MKNNLFAIGPLCSKCNIRMQKGKAIISTPTGIPDFIGGDVVTMSPGGPGRMIDCWKCPECGSSKSY